MFEQLIQRPHHLARHRSGPHAEERWRYLSQLIKEGRATITLQHAAGLLLSIAQRIPAGRRVVTLAQIESAAEAWLHSSGRTHCSAKSRHKARTTFIFLSKKWLRFLGRLHQPQKRRPFSTQLEAFIRFQSHERGLAPSTISRRHKNLTQFLAWAKHVKSLKQITAEDVSRYFCSAAVHRWGRGTIALCIDSLRSFFRFAESRRWCIAGLADMIDAPRIYRHEHLPCGPEWSDVQRLIAASSGGTAAEIRNRAILLLHAIYGLRNSEVRLLHLEDIDWEREMILVNHSKQRRSQYCPLVQEVGAAILRYLREVRPQTQRREIFVSLTQPYRPLTAGGMYSLVRGRQRRLGFVLSSYGPHSLRHACATHLLAGGFSLKEIGDHLGHMSTEATQIYAKVDLAALREVAQMDIRCLVDYADTSGRAGKPVSGKGDLLPLRAVATSNQGGRL